MKKHLLTAAVVIAVVGGIAFWQFSEGSSADTSSEEGAPGGKSIPQELKRQEDTSPQESASEQEAGGDEARICTCGCGEDILSCNCETAQQMRKEHFEQSG